MKRYKVALDAGHGMYPNRQDPGAVGPSGLREADVVKAICQKTARILMAHFDIIETRDETNADVTSQNKDLWHRVRKANDFEADLFVSFHCNAFGNPSANGTETFCHSFGGDGERLARITQEKILQAVPLTNRGVKTANFYVLRKTDMPAILIEFAFISNPTEEALLKDVDTQLKYAHAVANSIAQYFGINIPTQQQGPSNEPEYLGEFEATHYCPCDRCTGKDPSHPQYKVTFSGKIAKEGRTVAVDPNVIPLGTKLKVVYQNGTEMNLVAEDIGSAIKQNSIDVYMESHEKALQMGRQMVRVYKTGDPEEDFQHRTPAQKDNSINNKQNSFLPPNHPAMQPFNPSTLPQNQEPSTNLSFKDVSPQNWGYEWIKKAKERGIISGDGNGFFHPEEPASRQALVTVNEKTIEYIFNKLKQAGIDIND